MLTYKLIQYDKTCQWVINIINMEKTFAPNNFQQILKNVTFSANFEKCHFLMVADTLNMKLNFRVNIYSNKSELFLSEDVQVSYACVTLYIDDPEASLNCTSNEVCQ